MKVFMWVLFILILFFTQFQKAKSEMNIKNILLNDKTTTINLLDNSEYYFHISINDLEKISNYIQLIISNNDKELLSSNKYLIAYYGEDSSYTNIEQLSNENSPSNLWLNKEQIKNGFYLKIHKMNDICKNCETKLEIIQKSFIELTFNSSTFSYLVTEKNKNMNFIIKEKNDINPQLSHALIIWAYGNKEIKAYLNESNSIKHSKYNAYIINILDSYDDYKEYYFSINGTIGDILDIGFIFLNSYKWCKNCREEDMILYKIFLKQNILNYICFPFTYNNYENQYIQYIDDININAKVTQDKGNNQNCVQIPEDIDELFFSYHYLGRTHENNFNIFSLQIRNNYYQKIDEKTIIGFLPMRLEENFNSLTYYIQNLDPNKYKLNAYIGICKDFPFCLSSKDIIKTKILVYLIWIHIHIHLMHLHGSSSWPGFRVRNFPPKRNKV